MRDGKVFAQVIKILSSDENTLKCAEDVLACLWDSYHIAKISVKFAVGITPTRLESVEEKGEFALPNQKPEETISFEKTIITGEGGVIEIGLHKGCGYSDWTTEDKEEIDMILDVFFFHFGKFRMINRVKKSIMIDSRTGLPNIQGFIADAEKIINEKEIQTYNAYCFNLKRFGLINKKFGNNEADRILIRYAEALIDFMNEDECVARLGGDNFIALIKQDRTDEFLRFVSEVKVHATLAGRQVPVTISAGVGIYVLDETVEHYDQVISRSAMAMNVAKNVLKKPYLYYSQELNERVDMEKKILADFRQALKNREFQVYYQPKVETDAYEIVGAEALVRWVKNDELVLPGVFIPTIERDGSICDLDFYVLEQVCSDIKEWQEKGLTVRRVSVNFSRKHLSNPSLAEDIMDVLRRYGIGADYIEIEVTETVDEEEQGLLSEFMKKMKANHIAVAIDDFGTGYSSLNILRTFPVDVLKIDKSFIDNQEHTENDQVVLSNIVRMAKQLNMDVVSEGVENWEQVEFLHDMDCNIVQGFLFDKPIKKEDFEQRLQNKRYDETQVVDYVE
ncbi:MAG: bifunctional diguanylate cyclase/phosphodiesterase [Lachnospiraceae bacterium]|nr:bifunctional diguanylate cyclase/phosphodiesterase [Lachnospiraceae bacterium]